MKRYFVRYLIFWLPAFLVNWLVPESWGPAFAIRWFVTFFLLLGWAVNSGMAAAQYPRNTMASILIYFGVSLLLITCWYMGYLVRIFGRRWGYLIGGAFSYVPLDPLVRALLDFNIPHEVYATVTLMGFCLIGWLVGIIYRHLNPNPYRPKFKA